MNLTIDPRRPLVDRLRRYEEEDSSSLPVEMEEEEDDTPLSPTIDLSAAAALGRDINTPLPVDGWVTESSDEESSSPGFVRTRSFSEPGQDTGEGPLRRRPRSATLDHRHAPLAYTTASDGTTTAEEIHTGARRQRRLTPVMCLTVAFLLCCYTTFWLPYPEVTPVTLRMPASGGGVRVPLTPPVATSAQWQREKVAPAAAAVASSGDSRNSHGRTNWMRARMIHAVHEPLVYHKEQDPLVKFYQQEGFTAHSYTKEANIVLLLVVALWAVWEHCRRHHTEGHPSLAPHHHRHEHRSTTATTAATSGTRSKRQVSTGFTKLRFLAPIVLACLMGETAAVEEAECEADLPPPAVPGLHTVHPLPFSAIPEDAQKKVCVCPDVEFPVRRAFKARGWDVVHLERRTDKNVTFYDCIGKAQIMWTKYRPADYWLAHPWQRHNWLPMQNFMTHKGHFQRALIDHQAATGRKFPFVPDTYLLPGDRKQLLHRLAQGGMDEPWVIKLSATDNGVGIGIHGPNSEGMEYLNQMIWEHSDPQDYMMPLREKLVLAPQPGDLRDPAEVESARRRSLDQDDDIVVQRYICHEMDYQGRKFDLRLYFLVASVDPLIVFYHDGALRVSLSEYNDKVFETTTDHLSNLGRNDAMDNCTISLDEYAKDLQAHVAANPSLFPKEVAEDPLTHVRNQAKAALAELVDARRDVAFDGPRRRRSKMENHFSLLGADFIVDRDLHLWMTEAQSSPGFGHETKVRLMLYEQFLPSTVDIVTEVMQKQIDGVPLFPLENTGKFELIYTDEYKFTYDFEHKPQQRGPC